LPTYGTDDKTRYATLVAKSTTAVALPAITLNTNAMADLPKLWFKLDYN
jgi:hypothetical protein